MAKIRSYDASSIAVLSAMEGVRSNPGAYLGDVDSLGTQQCLGEVVQNATDETREIGGGRVTVCIHGNTVRVSDCGRGIPIEIHPKTGKSTLETVLTFIHAGGKTGSEKSAYGNRTIGVHGVGVSVVCALSTRMTVWTFRRNHWWRIDLSCGRVVKPLHKDIPKTRQKCGTIVEYELDSSIMKYPLPLASVRHYCHIIRHFDPIDIAYTDDKTQGEVLLLRREPSALLKLHDGEQTLLGPYDFNGNGVRVVLVWTNASDFSIQAHVAGTPVPNGTHVKGLEESITEAFANVRARDSKNINPLLGMRAVIDVSVDQPSFSGMAKVSLKTTSARRQVLDALTAPLTKYLKAHVAGLKAVLEHATRLSAINNKVAELHKLAGVTDAPRGRLAFPKGFVAALGTPPDRRECYLVEGDSALGTSEEAKLPHQEILPLRGKMANVISKTGAITSNEVVGGILRSIGYDPRHPEKPLRVGRVILLADADEDGCLAPNTCILTLDGKRPTIKQLSQEWNQNPKPFWVWSRNASGKLVPALAESPRITRHVKKLARVHLDTGGFIDATVDHEFMLNDSTPKSTRRDGHIYVQARWLRPGDSLVKSHKVVKVEIIDCETEVYCMTVPTTGNFMIADKNGNGVGSSNCHISVLLMTVFQRAAPRLIKEGRLFIVDAPLYEAMAGGHMVTGNNVIDMQRQYGKLTHINRMKGWGGAEVPLLRRVAFDPATRKLLKIASPSDKEVKGLTDLMGKVSATRKNLHNVENL